jgi:thiamine biosynthesis lipoprotein
MTGAATTRASFRAMGTDIEVLGPRAGFADALDTIARRFATEERRFSRFRGDSELTRINRSAGHPTTISSTMGTVLRASLDAAQRTEGRFDPTVLHALEAAGYDRDFDEILAGARGELHPAEPCGRWREIALDAGRVVLPPDIGIDLGGFVKGWTADAAAGDALATGIAWIAVNAGGDLRVDGAAPALRVKVEDPGDPSVTLVTLEMSTGALATTSVVKRAWGPDAHHVIDPRSGRPATSDVLQATVWAPTCAEAEVLAKDVLLLGAPAAAAHEAVVVTRDGDVVVSFTPQNLPADAATSDRNVA